MSSGERPIGAAKGKQPNTKALWHPPPPPPQSPLSEPPFPAPIPPQGSVAANGEGGQSWGRGGGGSWCPNLGSPPPPRGDSTGQFQGKKNPDIQPSRAHLERVTESLCPQAPPQTQPSRIGGGAQHPAPLGWCLACCGTCLPVGARKAALVLRWACSGGRGGG